MNRWITIIILMTFALNILQGEVLSLIGKNIAFFIDDKTGKFYLENPSPGMKNMKELLFKDMPPTSYITLILDGKPSRLNMGNINVKQAFQSFDNIISAQYLIDSVTFKLSFILTNLSGKEYDSILCLISVENNSSNQISAGAEVLI